MDITRLHIYAYNQQASTMHASCNTSLFPLLDYVQILKGESVLRMVDGTPTREVSVLNLLLTNDHGKVPPRFLWAFRP